MRTSRVLSLIAGAALLAACGDDNGGNGPQNQAPTANFAEPTCDLLTCTFTDASTDPDGTIASREWAFESGTPATSTEATQEVTFSGAGTWTVTLTVTDNEGTASQPFSREVTVSETPQNQPPSASFTVNCSSLDCTFTNTSTDADGTIVSYLWDFGDGNTSTEESPSHTYAVAELTEFSVTLTVTDDQGATGEATNPATPAPPASLTCGDTPDCSLALEADARVTVTLVSSECELSGNTFKVQIIPPGGGTPVEETLFTDGCDQTENPPGTTFELQSNAVFAAGTEIKAQVISGGTTLELPPALRLQAGSAYPAWTLEFDDGAQSEPPEPDFNDLVIQIVATPQ